VALIVREDNVSDLLNLLTTGENSEKETIN